MKRIRLFLVLGFVLIWNSFAGATLPGLAGKANISITGTGQDLWYQQVSAKTNIDGRKTNYNYRVRTTTTNFTVDDSSLLNLLANSFNTNFPAGAKLLLWGGTGSYFFAVSDSTGTNIVLVPNQVISSFNQGRVNSGIMTKSTTNNPSIDFTGNDTELFTTAITFQYDDSAMITADGLHRSFSWSGLAETKGSHNVGTGFTKENVTIHLTGGGDFPGPSRVIFNGTIRATLTGVEPFP